MTADRLRAAAATLFLLAQVAGVVRSRFVPESWFSWAPHDRQVEYRLEVTVDGRALSADEIAERYRMPAAGWNSHGVADLKDVVRRAEGRGAAGATTVRLVYRDNGRPETTWTWPEEGGR